MPLTSTWKNPTYVGMKCLHELKNEICIVDNFDTSCARESLSKEQKPGNTPEFIVRKPLRWTVNDGAQRVPQAVNQPYVTVTINRQKQIGFDYTAWEDALNIDDLYEQCFQTQITQLANAVDRDAAQFIRLATNNFVGVVGTSPASIFEAQQAFLNARATIVENGGDVSTIRAVVSPRYSANSQAYLNQMFNPAGMQSEQYKKGDLAHDAWGYKKISDSANVPQHTVGVFVGTPLVNGAVAEGATTITVDGLTAGDIINAGECFTAGTLTYDVNPLTRESLGYLKRIKVLQTVVADSGGNATLQVSCGGIQGGIESLRGPGQYQNMAALPADNDALTFWPGTSSPSGKTGTCGFAFTSKAFGFFPIVFRSPDKDGAWGKTVRDPKTGISLTIAKQYNIDGQFTGCRIDMGYDFASFYPDNEACLIMGA